MSSPKGNSNSNKTAHVMNLLRKSNPTPPPADDPVEEVATAPAPSAAPVAPAAPAAPAPAAAPIPPIITALNADVEISSQIRDALEQELMAEVAPEPPAPPQPKQESIPEPEPVPESPAPVSGAKLSQDEIEKMLAGFAAESEPEPQPEPVPVSTASASGAKLSQDEIEKMLAGFAAESEPVPQPEPVPVSTAPASGAKMTQDEIEKMLAGFAAESEPVPQPEPVPVSTAPASGTKMTQDEIEKMLAGFAAESEPEPQPMDDSEFFNVMHRLTEEKADRYISMFGLCDCKRCRQDVIALALNGLAPKYVVMPPAEMTVRSDMYSVRHSGEITAQLLHACREVMEHPRHKGKE